MVDFEITLANYCLCFLRQTKVKLPRRNQHFSLDSLAPSLEFLSSSLSLMATLGSLANPMRYSHQLLVPLLYIQDIFLSVGWERGR